MFSPESMLHNQIGKLQPPTLPGLNSSPNAAPTSNPFSGIRRAGQAKREQSFEKFQQSKNSPMLLAANGQKNQFAGGQAGTQQGSMRQMKF